MYGFHQKSALHTLESKYLLYDLKKSKKTDRNVCKLSNSLRQHFKLKK